MGMGGGVLIVALLPLLPVLLLATSAAPPAERVRPELEAATALVELQRAALATEPGDATLRTQLAVALLQQNAVQLPRGAAEAAAWRARNGEAAALLRTALRDNPLDAYSWNNLGVALPAATEETAAAFGRAVALAPANALFQRNLAGTLTLLGPSRLAEAAVALDRATALDPVSYKPSEADVGLIYAAAAAAAVNAASLAGPAATAVPRTEELPPTVGALWERLAERDFRNTYLERLPLHFVPAAGARGRGVCLFCGLVTVDEVLGKGFANAKQAHGVPNVGFVRGGFFHANHSFFEGRGVHTLRRTHLELQLQNDHTLFFNRMENLFPPLLDLVLNVSRTFDRTSAVNLYMASHGAARAGGGVAPHCDHHDVLILQLTGRKRWRMWPNRGSLLTMSDEEEVGKHAHTILASHLLGEPYLDVVLRPGHVLYMPRGTIHATDLAPPDDGPRDGPPVEEGNRGGYTAHLTVGFGYPWGGMTLKSFLSDVLRLGLAKMHAAPDAGRVLEDALAWLFAKSGQRLAFPANEQFTEALADAFDAALHGLTMVEHDLAYRRTVPLEVTRPVGDEGGAEGGGEPEWLQRMRLLAFRAMRYLVKSDAICAGFVANATAAEYAIPPPLHDDDGTLLEMLDELVEHVFDKTDAVAAATSKVRLFLESWRAMIEAGGEAKVRAQLDSMGLLGPDGQVREEALMMAGGDSSMHHTFF